MQTEAMMQLQLWYLSKILEDKPQKLAIVLYWFSSFSKQFYDHKVRECYKDSPTPKQGSFKILSSESLQGCLGFYLLGKKVNNQTDLSVYAVDSGYFISICNVQTHVLPLDKDFPIRYKSGQNLSDVVSQDFLNHQDLSLVTLILHIHSNLG